MFQETSKLEGDVWLDRWLSAPAPRRTILIGILGLYVLIAGLMARTKLPICDEAWFNLPAQMLDAEGQLATPVLEIAGTNWRGVDRHTYWILPAYPVMEAGWFLLAGPSLYTARAFSVLCGVIALLSLYAIIWKLLNSRSIALLSIAILSLDYPFLVAAANARMDMLCLALGLGALAFYLANRQARLGLAIAVAQGLTALSLLTHANGIIFFVLLPLFIALFDFKRFRGRHYALAIAPWAVLGGAYLWYILQDFDSYRVQFGAQSSNRLRPIWRPKELLEGFQWGVLDPFGFSALGTRRAIQYNVISLAIYLAGLLSLALSPGLRRIRNMRFVWLMIVAAAGWLILHHSLSSSEYIIFLTAFLSLPLAINTVFWKRSVLPSRWIWWGLLAAFAAVSLAGVAIRARHDDYRDKFLATLDFLKSSPYISEGAFASAEFAFPYGSMPTITDDNLLGFYTHRHPALIVLDQRYAEATTDWSQHATRDREQFTRYRERLLENEYRLIRDDGAYKVYARRTGPT